MRMSSSVMATSTPRSANRSTFCRSWYGSPYRKHQVSLHAEAVEGRAGCLELLHEDVVRVRLRARGLDVVVVEIELDVWVGGADPAQGVGDVARAENSGS